MTRHILAVLLALVLLFVALPANGEEKAPQRLTNAEGFVYTVKDDGTAEIAGYTGKEKKLIIPDSLDGHIVTSIGVNAFCFLPITEVTVPRSVREIKGAAFQGCNNLVTVHLAEGLEVLGDAAFAHCGKLKTINLPYSLHTVVSNPFAGCSKLGTVTLPDDHPALELIDGVLFSRDSKRLLWYPAPKKDKTYSVPDGTTVIVLGAFMYAKVTSIFIPDSVVEIEREAFYWCEKLQEINIPACVTSIQGVFSFCKSLKRVTVSPENQTFYELDGVLFQRDTQELVYYPTGRTEKQYEIPEGTQSIAEKAFAGASITGIIIPGSVKTIGIDAFNCCTKLKTVLLDEGVEEIQHGAFSACSVLSQIRLPNSLVKLGDGVFEWCDKLNQVIVDDDHPALTMMNGALVRKEDMRLVWYPAARKDKSYVLPTGIKSIGTGAFWGCTQLTEITLVEGLETIGFESFADCTKLKRIVLPASLTEIDRTAFNKYGGQDIMLDATYVVVRGSYADSFCQAYKLKIEYAQ